MSSRLELVIGTTAYGGWQSVSVRRSIEWVSGEFTLTVTDRWADQPVRRAIKPGDACRITIDGETVITGYVDDVEVDYSAESHRVTVRGRDGSGDLVDCSAVLPPYEYHDIGLPELATTVAEPFGISVRADVDLGEAFTRFSIQPGEAAFEAIERAARQRAVLVMSDGEGGVVLTRASAAPPAAGVLKLGGDDGNILSGRGQFSHRDRYSEYIVRGQEESSDFSDVETESTPEGRATDPGVRRYRPLIVLAESTGNAQSLADRAAWQARVTAGRSKRATYTVPDWRVNGTLWKPLTLVTVRDAFADIDGQLLIASVTFSLSAQGTTTSIEATLPSAFDLIAEPEEDVDEGLFGT